MLGSGSRFTVRIDAGENADRHLISSEEEIPRFDFTPQPPQVLDQLQGRILLADDNTDNQQLISYFIGKMGPRVELAGNGQIALDLVCTQDFDLVLMDMQMPVMSGTDAVKQIRQRGLQLPIIALTANATREDKAVCLEVGCNDFLTKPIDRKRLYQVLSEYLAMKDDDRAGSLYSTMLVDEPEMSDLVEKYCTRLPGQVEQFKQALRKGDMDSLRRLAHDLKGAGGGMGFPALTDIAVAIEDRLKQQDVNHLDVLVEELESIVQRIIQGMVESKAAGLTRKPSASHDAA